MTTIKERNWYVSEEVVDCGCDDGSDRYGRHNRWGDCECDCHQPPNQREMWVDTDDIVAYARCKTQTDKSIDGNKYTRVETTLVEQCEPDDATHVIIRGAAIKDSDRVFVLTPSSRVYELKQTAAPIGRSCLSSGGKVFSA